MEEAVGDEVDAEGHAGALQVQDVAFDGAEAQVTVATPEGGLEGASCGDLDEGADDAHNFMVKEFYGAMQRSNMEKQFRFHDLRHYAVSCLIQQGANVLLVSRVAGHARPSMTLDVYSHVFDEELAEAALRFDPLMQGRQLARPEADDAS